MKQRHSHRFLIPGGPALTIGCVKGGEAINVVTSKTPFTQPIGKSDTAGALVPLLMILMFVDLTAAECWLTRGAFRPPEHCPG